MVTLNRNVSSWISVHRERKRWVVMGLVILPAPACRWVWLRPYPSFLMRVVTSIDKNLFLVHMPCTTVSKHLQPCSGTFRMECLHGPTSKSLSKTCLQGGALRFPMHRQARLLRLLFYSGSGSHFLSRMCLFSLISPFWHSSSGY